MRENYFFQQDVHSIMLPVYLKDFCWPSLTSSIYAIPLTLVFHNLVPIFPKSPPDSSSSLSPPPLIGHTHRPQCLLTIPHHFMSFFTLANNISFMQSIHSSRSSSDVPSSVELSPTLSGPHSYFLFWAPTGPCPHLIREHHLFPGVIPPVNLEQGICHVHWRTASVLWRWVLHRYAIHSASQWINSMWSWSNFIGSLCFNFLIFKTGTTLPCKIFIMIMLSNINTEFSAMLNILNAQ